MMAQCKGLHPRVACRKTMMRFVRRLLVGALVGVLFAKFFGG